jgi:transcriptional regulator with XRE-family HTH domain
MAPKKKPEHHRGKTYLRQWRKLRKLTLAKASERVDIDGTTLGRIERGELPYNQDFLERLAHAYGCDPADFLNIDPLKPDPPRLVYSRLQSAPHDVQVRALAVLEALLKAG